MNSALLTLLYADCFSLNPVGSVSIRAEQALVERIFISSWVRKLGFLGGFEAIGKFLLTAPS
jgi:hypothetical protein